MLSKIEHPMMHVPWLGEMSFERIEASLKLIILEKIL